MTPLTPDAGSLTLPPMSIDGLETKVAKLEINSRNWDLIPINITTDNFLQFTATIQNNGNCQTRDVRVRFYKDDTLGPRIADDQIIPLIPAEGSATASVTWDLDTVNNYTICVEVDPRHEICESDSSNNILIKTFINANLFGMPQYTPGRELGYFIWCDEDDHEWHIRWTTDQPTYHSFDGTILGAAAFSRQSVRSYCFEPNDTFWIDEEHYHPRWISYDASEGRNLEPGGFWEGGDTIDYILYPIPDSAIPVEPQPICLRREDGLRFKICGYADKAVEFDIMIDSLYQPNNIFIGIEKINPPTIPFSLIGPAGNINCEEQY
jgi:hypothetical protein